MGFSWRGKDGQTYEVSQVTDKHLRFAHRMFLRWLKDIEKNPRENSRAPELQTAVGACENEMKKRNLDPLPPLEEAVQAVATKKENLQSELQKEVAELKQARAAYHAVKAKKAKLQKQLAELEREVAMKEEVALHMQQIEDESQEFIDFNATRKIILPDV